MTEAEMERYLGASMTASFVSMMEGGRTAMAGLVVQLVVVQRLALVVVVLKVSELRRKRTRHDCSRFGHGELVPVPEPYLLDL